eukprot:scpid20029/ scgid8581/ DNA damage-binding protein 1; Damage-specific DNA-binding protein 1
MAYNYVVTAQSSTSVHQCLKANITGKDDVNLLVAKGRNLELSLSTAEGLKPMLVTPIRGHIEVMLAYRPENSETDHIFLLTERLWAMVFSYDQETKEFVTHCCGDAYQRTGRPCDTGFIGVIDPRHKVIALRLYAGMIKIIPLEQLHKSQQFFTFDVRLEHLQLIDMCFLHNSDQPTLAYIHQDEASHRHVQTVVLDIDEQEIKAGPWSRQHLEVESHMIIPVEDYFGGVVIVGQQTILYHSGASGKHRSVAPPELKRSVIQCHCMLDHSRILLSDISGTVFMLLLREDPNSSMPGRSTVGELRLEDLGKVTSARSISYLDNSVVYIGSPFGDSQLVRLLADANEQGSFLEVIDTIVGIGPITDMAVVDQDRQGQGSVVTCSGYGHTGSLRVVRSGIGIQEVAVSDTGSTIQGVWAIACGADTDLHSAVVVALIEQTIIVQFTDDELGQMTDGHDFVQSEETIFASNLSFGFIIQVVESQVRLIEATSISMKQEWKPPCGMPITAASSNSEQVVVACSEHLYYLTVSEDGLIEESHTVLDNEVSCIDVSVTTAGNRTNLCAIALWKDISVLLLRLPSLELVTSAALGGELVSRSVVMCVFEGQDYLFVSMGDGGVVYFPAEFSTGQLGQRKRVVLGTQPTTMRPFHTASSFNIFVCSDRPSVIYSSNSKLLFANVNFKVVDYVCPINTAAYRDSLIIVSQSVMTFGKVDDIQKLHIRCVHLGETPRRIAFDEVSGAFGVVVDREVATQQSVVRMLANNCSGAAQNEKRAKEMEAAAEDSDPLVVGGANAPRMHVNPQMISTFCVIDMQSFEILHAHELLRNENVMSLCVVHFANEPEPFFCVGSAIPEKDDDQEEKQGYIHLFQWKDSKFLPVAQKEVGGAVYSLSNFNGKLLAAVNNCVAVYEWTDSKELRCECQHQEFIMCLFLKVKGDFILCGDLMRSLSLLQYKVEGTLEVVASDFQTNWVYAIDILDYDSFIGAEEYGNLFTVMRDSSATSDDELRRLSVTGRFHISDHVNVFRHGSLTMKDNESKLRLSSVLFGTVSGSVGVIITLKKETFEFLQELQNKLAAVITTVGNIPFAEFRSFASSGRREPMFGFIDGDLIESFLDLPTHKMEEVASGLQRSEGPDRTVPVTVDYLNKFVEELTRFH